MGRMFLLASLRKGSLDCQCCFKMWFDDWKLLRLSHIYEKYKTQGLEILAFPCNQFGGQEPGSNPEIKQFACTRFKAEFPILIRLMSMGQVQLQFTSS
ncbi:hypothetical protein RGQ29_010283 [Quercus rubra]|uniref:Glutathione peroxidase n=1 Tax=Quercus rubra TaxID=3512 RepID=A0AAN7FU48_QUERU|nr:hypothetical protein RGQ29_010283 [Quercus rubra]